MSRLLLVRHGNTRKNSAERFWGHTDVALSTDGVKQAEQLRHRLESEKIDFAYASDLCRASLTAEIIAGPHRLEVVICTELHEINFGKVEGLNFKEISQQYPALAADWSTRDLNFRFPEGESIGDLNRRVSQFLNRLEKHAPEDTLLIVAHSGVLRLLVCQLLEIAPQHWRQIRTDLASLTIVETYPQGAILNLLNDTSHLK
ncbi:MAG: alpha-ribazole phosphatase [Chloroflexi bacterium]|nr:alpha-ribazole phosphatase [Chloroflexota bacterium]